MALRAGDEVNIELLIKLLRRDEGVKDHPYKDSKGYWTIGIGHLIDRRLGGSLPSWIKPSFPLSQAEIAELCLQDIKVKTLDVARELPFFNDLNDTRQIVLVSMAFQMGVSGMLQFKKALQAMMSKRWAEAAAEMLDSDWHREDSPQRAKRLARAMETGDATAFEL